MIRVVILCAIAAMLPAMSALAADAPKKTAATQPAHSAVDPAKAAEHEKADIERHRQIAVRARSRSEMPRVGPRRGFVQRRSREGLPGHRLRQILRHEAPGVIGLIIGT